MAFSGWLAFCAFDGGTLELSGVFGWLAEFGFEFLYSPFRHIKPLPQRSNQRILLGVAQKTEVGWRGHAAFRIDSTATLSTNFLPSGADYCPLLTVRAATGEEQIRLMHDNKSRRPVCNKYGTEFLPSNCYTT